MSMPFYVSPEQVIKDKADYARKGIARGRSVVVVQYADGILFVAENPSRALHKVSEIYDRIALRRGRQVQRVREPARRRGAAGRRARLLLRPPRRDRRAGWPTPTPRPSARSSPRTTSPTRSRSSWPRSATPAEDDQLYRLTFDGSVGDEHGYVAMGGQAEAIADALEEAYSDGMELGAALRTAVRLLGRARGRRRRAPSSPPSSRWPSSTAPARRRASSVGSPTHASRRCSRG